MITLQEARSIALSFDEAQEQPHFEKLSFRVNKKIFLTLDEKNQRGCVKLSEIDQDVFHRMNPGIVYPVPNKWGMQGWTLIEFKEIDQDILTELLVASYCHVAPARLALKFSQSKE